MREYSNIGLLSTFHLNHFWRTYAAVKWFKRNVLNNPRFEYSRIRRKSGLTEINKGLKPRLSHVVQRFNHRLSYVLVACHLATRPLNPKSRLLVFKRRFVTTFVPVWTRPEIPDLKMFIRARNAVWMSKRAIGIRGLVWTSLNRGFRGLVATCDAMCWCSGMPWSFVTTLQE